MDFRKRKRYIFWFEANLKAVLKRHYQFQNYSLVLPLEQIMK